MSCPSCPPGTKIKNLCVKCKAKYNTDKAERSKKNLWNKRKNLDECKLPRHFYAKTHIEIANKMGISKNRVCVLERNALSKLRKNKELQDYKDTISFYASVLERGF